MKKMLATLLVAVLLLGMLPMHVAAADTGFSDYYGREALAKLPNASSLLYAYDQIAEGIERTVSPISVSDASHSITVDELDVVMKAYRRDYVQHFWLGNRYSYSYAGNNVRKVMPDYLLQGTTLEFAKQAMEEAADEILAGITPSMTDWDKELYLHDALAERVTYVESENAHSAYGALVDGEAVCEGYAEALQYLLHRVGIQSFIAIGSSVNPGSLQPEGHAWNYVRINGRYYHVDLTWNDQDSHLYHAYFNVDDATILQDHAMEDTVFALPECNSLAANYFKIKGGWMDTYTVQSVAKLLRNNQLTVSVYVPGDAAALTSWYYANIRDIAKAIPIVGGYSYGYSRMGNEVILRMSGSMGEAPDEPDEPENPEVPEEPDNPNEPDNPEKPDDPAIPAQNGWIKEDSKWYFYENGVAVTNKWMKDSIGWVYLDADGAMKTNAWVMDSVGWCYVGDNGYAVTNCWKADTKGWCYLDAQGRMATNKWIKDSVGWCFVGTDGYCVTNCWKKDSIGWCYLDENGRMATNRWVRDSVGWCYVGADGYAVTNCWKKDSVGWCYLNNNGSMTKNAWVQDGGKWYYLDGNGYMVAGKSLTIGGKIYTFGNNGVWIS